MLKIGLLRREFALYDNEQLVMRKLGISSWKDLSKDKFMAFISIMPEMSDEVRKKIIEQLPQFVQLCSEGLGVAKDAFHKIIDKDEKITEVLIAKIDRIYESISQELGKSELSFEQRKFIIEQLMILANIYNEMDERNKKFFDTIYGKLLTGLGIIVGLVVAFAGGESLHSSKKEED